MRDHLPNLERFYGCDMRQSAADALKHHMTQQLSARNIQVLFRLLDFILCVTLYDSVLGKRVLMYWEI